MEEGAWHHWVEALPDWERDGPGPPSGTTTPVGDEGFSPLPTRRCLEALGVLPPPYRVLHVVGSNGKGTAAAATALLLRRFGCRVGVYQSPHLRSRLERFSIDGVPIDRQRYAALMTRLQEVAPDGLSRFEVETAAACLYFAEEGVDVAVLEAGLGGVTDATHAVAADVVALTSVEREHTAVLGDSLAAIARQKAGVLPVGGWLVSGALPDDAEAAVVELVASREARWWRADHMLRVAAFTAHGDGAQVTLSHAGEEVGVTFPLGLWGRHLTGAVVVAVLAARAMSQVLGLEWSDEALLALGEWKLPGRLQLVHETPPIVLDVAHTPHAVAAAVVACRAHLGALPDAVLLALQRDKPLLPLLFALADQLEATASSPAALILAPNPGPRGAQPADMVRALAGDVGLAERFRVTQATAVVDGWDALLATLSRQDAARPGCGLALGSFRLAGALLDMLHREEASPTC